MSEYMMRQKMHLLDVLKTLIDEDILAYLYDSPDSAWAVVYHRPTKTVMTISYEGVNGLCLGSCLKPNKMHGTGYQCLEPGFRWITKEDFVNACGLSKSLLARDLISAKATEIPNCCTSKDLLTHLYRDLDEYFEIRHPNEKDRFIRVVEDLCVS